MELYGKHWPKDFTKRFFVGMHMLDKDQNSSLEGVLSGFNARDFVTRLADTGCDTVYFYMSCHMGNCYYPTKIKPGRVFSWMNGRDFFGETIRECARQKIALVAVYEFDNNHFRMKPDSVPGDWNHHKSARRETPLQRPSLCWNGGYGDFVLEQIKEAASLYPVAGFYIDMLDYPGRNLCPSCAEKFLREFKENPPDINSDTGTPLFKNYKMWTYRQQADYLKRVRKEVNGIIPGATVVNNFHFMICEDLYEVRDAVSYVTTDPGIGYTRGFGATYVFGRSTKTGAVYRSLMEGKDAPFDILFDNPVLGNLQIMPRDPYLGVAATALMNGGWPCLSSMWALDGTLNPAALGLAREIYEHIDKVKPWVGNWKSIKTAGVYLSQESQLLYAKPGDKPDAPAHNYTNSFYGAMSALEYEHIMADVLTRRQLCRLSEYSIIYLPNAVCLSEYEVKKLREYVKNGGTLIASYRASLANEWGQFRENFQLADVFGADYAGAKIEPYIAHQMKVLNPERYPFSPWENPMVTVQEALLVKPRKGAKILADLHERYRPSSRPDELPKMSNAFVREAPSGPAIVENRYGKGRCVYFAARIFCCYFNTKLPEIQKLAARWLVSSEISGAPVVLRNVPACIKMAVFERPEEGRWLIHLANIQSAPGEISGGLVPITEFLLPVYNLEIVLNAGSRKIKNISLAVSGERMDFSAENGACSFNVPRVDVHEVVIVDFDSRWTAPREEYLDRDPVKMLRCPADAGGAKEKILRGFDDNWDGLGAGQSEM